MRALLQDDTLILRALEPEDLEFLYASENNPEIWQVSQTLAPYSKFVLKQYLENAHHDIYTHKQLRLIIALKQAPENAVGAIDLFDFDPYHQRAGVGILIHASENRNKGLAKAALKLLISYTFNYLKLHQLYCNIGAENSASIHLFEQAGFVKCGLKKDWNQTAAGWQDELMYQLVQKTN